MRYINRISWICSFIILFFSYISSSIGDDDFNKFRRDFIDGLYSANVAHLLKGKHGRPSITVKQDDYDKIDKIIIEIYPELEDLCRSKPVLFHSIFTADNNVWLSELYAYLSILRSTPASKLPSIPSEETDYCSDFSSKTLHPHEKYQKIIEQYGLYYSRYGALPQCSKHGEYLQHTTHSEDFESNGKYIIVHFHRGIQPNKAMILFLKDGSFIAVQCSQQGVHTFSHITEHESIVQINQMNMEDGLQHIRLCQHNDGSVKEYSSGYSVEIEAVITLRSSSNINTVLSLLHYL